MHSHLRILFKLTTFGRPAWAMRALYSIQNNVINPNYRIMLTVDINDPTLNMGFYKQLNNINNLLYYVGKDLPETTKISAINRDVNKFMAWDILVNVSDDQIFIEKGFDDIIRFNMWEHFQDLDGVLHFPDGNRSDLMTMSIMGRAYYHMDNYIYYPEYVTECCDDEAQEVAKLRGKYKFINHQILDHLHCSYGKAAVDESYKKNLTHEKQEHDRRLLFRRRSIHFGLIGNDVPINEHKN